MTNLTRGVRLPDKVVEIVFHVGSSDSETPMMGHQEKGSPGGRVPQPRLAAEEEAGKSRRQPKLQRVSIRVDQEQLIEMSRSGGSEFGISFVNRSHPEVANLIGALDQLYRDYNQQWSETATEAEGVAGLSERLAQRVPEAPPKMTIELEGILPKYVRHAQSGHAYLLQPESRLKRWLNELESPGGAFGGSEGELSALLVRLLPILLEDWLGFVSWSTRIALDRCIYIGPLRTQLPRHLAWLQEEDPDWISGGGSSWQVILQNSEIRGQVNNWLGRDVLSTPYEFRIRHLVEPDHFLAKLIGDSDSLNTALKEFGSGNPDDPGTSLESTKSASKLTNVLRKIAHTGASADSLLDMMGVQSVQELVLVDRRTNSIVSHRDVGVGISQVLPVLVHSFAANRTTVLIEQPEIHLHPALQADLGDLFINSAVNRSNTLIVETHSEHLILRLLRRIRETRDGELPEGATPLYPNQLAVLYVDPTHTGSELLHIPVTDEGEFAERWPSGFFEERAEELF